MEWIQGAYAMTKEYYLTKVYGKPEGEKHAGPDLPPGENVSWVRIPFSRPVFANADSIELVFRMRDAKGKPGVVTFTIPVVYYQQKVTPEASLRGHLGGLRGQRSLHRPPAHRSQRSHHLWLGFRESGGERSPLSNRWGRTR